MDIQIRWKPISSKWVEEIPCEEKYILNGGYNEQYVNKKYIESYLSRQVALCYAEYDFEMDFSTFLSIVNKKNTLFYKKLNSLFYKKICIFQYILKAYNN